MSEAVRGHPVVGPAILEYQNRHQTVHRMSLDFGTFEKTLYVTDYGPRVGIVIHGLRGVLLTRQYRHLIARLSWEIPGGRVEAGEDLAKGVMRECQEETGLLPRDLQPLLMFHPGLETLHNPTHLFFCTEFDAIGERIVEEVPELEWVPLEAALDMIRDGRILDALSIVALTAYGLLRPGVPAVGARREVQR
jgi:8-oxo-dGTP pyrophosphatase MutT (NUDIX family)